MASWWTVSLRLVPLVLLFSLQLAVSRPICVPMLLVNPLQHSIDMFNPDNFGAGLKVEMDCSRLMEPEITVTVEPTLQAELISKEAVNKKVSVGYRCSGGVEHNVTTTLRTMPPWFTVLNGLQRPLNLGDECNLFGCYWYENASNRYTAVAWALKTTSCVIDYNECADGTAQCEHICTDIVNSYNCSCYDGYQLDQNGHNCSDIDECSTGEHLCSHTCTNTVGGYQCSCPVGFQIGGDNHTCMDINECESENLCEFDCSNINGSYECICPLGFELTANGYNCTDIDECSRGGVCDQMCSNTNGSYSCSCGSGYALDSNGHSCNDIDECDVEKGALPCEYICTNTDGGYECSCPQGYILSEDAHNCTAIPSAGSKIPQLVYYVPWLALLLLAGGLVISVCTYYCFFKRRRSRPNVFPDLYKFYLTNEEVDYTYEPVDLTNGLSPPDSQSMQSEMTFFQTSNTTENLKQYASDVTHIVAVEDDKSLDGTEKQNHDASVAESKDQQSNNTNGEEGGICFVNTQATSDSCIGSSIASDFGSSSYRPSTLTYTEDTSAGTFSQVSNTSATSDYVSQVSLSTPTTAHSCCLTPSEAAPPELTQGAEDIKNTEASSAQRMSEQERPAFNVERKDSPNAKDYIHESILFMEDYRMLDDDNEDSVVSSQTKTETHLRKTFTGSGGDSSAEPEDPTYGALLVMSTTSDSDLSSNSGNMLPETPSEQSPQSDASLLPAKLNLQSCAFDLTTKSSVTDNSSGLSVSSSSAGPRYVIRGEPGIAQE